MLSRFGSLLPRLPSAHRHVQCRPAVSLCVSEWAGLEAWRSAPLNEDRWWDAPGPRNLEQVSESWHVDCALKKSLGGRCSEEPNGVGKGHAGSEPDAAADGPLGVRSLAEWGALVLRTSCPYQKSALTHRAFQLWYEGDLSLGFATAPDTPASPSKPELVHPRDVPLLMASPLPQNAHVLHNLAHIEFNAINLAWDTVVRFSSQCDELGVRFFSDFAHVADDESRHLGWCLQRLKELGYSYGDMPAHNLLWKDCAKTSGNVQARLAVIPMTQEARGLDAGPRLVEKLIAIGDRRTAGIVEKIVEEELAHVAVGVSWFRSICSRLDVDPEASFRGMMEDYKVQVKGPFNYQARAEAGLPREWFDSVSVPEQVDTLAKKKRPRGKRAHREPMGTTSSPLVERATLEPHGVVRGKAWTDNADSEMLMVSDGYRMDVAYFHGTCTIIVGRK